MERLTLIIGNKNYSSWSLRAWLLLKHLGVSFEEIVVPQNQMPGRLAVIYKGPAGYRFQTVNSGFEGTVMALGAVPGEGGPPSLVAVNRRRPSGKKSARVKLASGDTIDASCLPERASQSRTCDVSSVDTSHLVSGEKASELGR